MNVDVGEGEEASDEENEDIRETQGSTARDSSRKSGPAAKSNGGSRSTPLKSSRRTRRNANATPSPGGLSDEG